MTTSNYSSLNPMRRLLKQTSYLAYRAGQQLDGGNPCQDLEAVNRIRAHERWLRGWLQRMEDTLEPPTMEAGDPLVDSEPPVRSS